MKDDAAANNIVNHTDKVSIRPLAEVCAELHERVEAFLRRPPTSEIERKVQEQTRISQDVIEDALKRYELSSLSLSYNGGKDCLVLLILFLSSLHTHISTGTSTNAEKPSFPSTIPAIYAYPPDPFPAVTSFVESSSAAYHLDLAHIPTNPRPVPGSSLPRITLRDAFASYLTPRPHIRAIFVGTRRTDPHGENLTFFDPTDHGWPSFMRIHPVIDWRLAEIWAFLRADEIRGHGPNALTWCQLYDQGYTSLGGKNDTLPNPKLGRGDGTFAPAWEMDVDGEERLGREGVAK